MVQLSLSRLVGRIASGVKDRVVTAINGTWKSVIAAKGNVISETFTKFFEENRQTPDTAKEIVGKFVYPLVSEKQSPEWRQVLQEAGLESPPVVI